MGHPLLTDVPCEDAVLCHNCVKRRVGREVQDALAADRDRIAQAIREDLYSPDANLAEQKILARLLRVVEGG